MGGCGGAIVLLTLARSFNKTALIAHRVETMAHMLCRLSGSGFLAGGVSFRHPVVSSLASRLAPGQQGAGGEIVYFLLLGLLVVFHIKSTSKVC